MIHEILYWLFGIGQDYICSIAPLVGAALVSAAASGAQYLGNNVQNNRLSRAQKEQNAFNAQQALEERLWSEKMKKWDVELANSAHQREVQDMVKAGLNPALLYGSAPGTGAAVPSAASGAAASGSYTPSQIDVPNLGATLMNLRAQQAQIENVEAQTNKIKSETTGQDIQNEYAESYWRNQIGIMESSRSKIIADTELTEQKLKTEEYQTAISANNLDVSWLESQVKMYETFMTKLDYKSKQEILDLQMDCMRAAAAKDNATVDALTAQLGEIVARTGLAMNQAGYFKHLGREQKAIADFWSSDEGKDALKKSAEGSAEKSYREGKFSKYGVWLTGIGNFVKDVGIGVGSAMAVKNLKGALAAQQVVPSNLEPTYGLPGD